MSMTSFRNGWPLALFVGAVLVTGVALAQEPQDSSRDPDPSKYSIAPEGSLPAPDAEEPDLPDEPFGQPPERSVREPEFGNEEASPSRERQFHLEMDDR